jgi:hypothetical protein
MNAKHTPGPWSISGDLVVGAPESRPNPKVEPHPHSVAKLCWDFDGDRGANGDLPWLVAEANAQLIAAAPELLEALQFIVNDAEPGEDAQLTTAGYNRACAAIRKALGESVPA